MLKSDLVSLKQLAKACRVAGIRSFKGHGIEFTLDDAYEAPKRQPKAANKVLQPLNETPIQQQDELSDEALLFWSASQENEILKGDSN